MKREDLYARSSLEYDGLDNYIESLGGNFPALMKEVGLNPGLDKDEVHFIEWEPLCNLYELASERLDEPYFGLKWAFGIPDDFRNSGPTLFIAELASNMRHFLNMVLEYQKIHTNGVAYSYEENVETHEFVGVIAIHPLSPPCRQFSEHIVASIAVMGRRYIPNFTLKRVTLQHRVPEDLTWYNKAFECPIEFNADRNTMIMDLSFLGLAKPNIKTKFLTKLIKTYLNWKMDKNSRAMTSMSAAVAETLPSILGVKNSNIYNVASIFDMHPKKLQRLLNDENTSYSAILDDVRKNMACRLLRDSDISIHRIAKLLDYSSDRPFTTAAKRWFDMSPTQYRKELRSDQ